MSSDSDSAARRDASLFGDVASRLYCAYAAYVVTPFISMMWGLLNWSLTRIVSVGPGVPVSASMVAQLAAGIVGFLCALLCVLTLALRAMLPIKGGPTTRTTLWRTLVASAVLGCVITVLDLTHPSSGL